VAQLLSAYGQLCSVFPRESVDNIYCRALFATIVIATSLENFFTSARRKAVPDGSSAMKLKERIIGIRSSIETGLLLSACILILSYHCAVAQQTPGAQRQSGVSAETGPLTIENVVDRLIEMNLRRARALHSFQGTRTYRVEYKSVFSSVKAEMLVEVKYQAPETKHFIVKSSSGSKLIVDKVFMKLLEAEEDALSRDGQRSTALNRDNYDFKLVGYMSTPSRPMYVLTVDPKTKSKFLFRGKIWVDANDFAVVRLEAVPAKNPSFWTKNNEIEQLYKKVDDFWLPERNHSVSSIRLGGHADLTIEYQDYEITASDPVGSTTATAVARSADTSFTLDARKHLLTTPQKQGP
jgi:outer membrane lipoprotein-sorting protein